MALHLNMLSPACFDDICDECDEPEACICLCHAPDVDEAAA